MWWRKITSPQNNNEDVDYVGSLKLESLNNPNHEKYLLWSMTYPFNIDYGSLLKLESLKNKNK